MQSVRRLRQLVVQVIVDGSGIWRISESTCKVQVFRRAVKRCERLAPNRLARSLLGDLMRRGKLGQQTTPSNAVSHSMPQWRPPGLRCVSAQPSRAVQLLRRQDVLDAVLPPPTRGAKRQSPKHHKMGFPTCDMPQDLVSINFMALLRYQC
jgi:hypothetical protein